MNKQPIRLSSEMIAGAVMLAVGLLLLSMGRHDVVSQALAPFGAGIILFDLITRFGRATRETVKVLIRRDKE